MKHVTEMAYGLLAEDYTVIGGILWLFLLAAAVSMFAGLAAIFASAYMNLRSPKKVQAIGIVLMIVGFAPFALLAFTCMR